MTELNKQRPGRPLGFKLTEESKGKIRESRLGQTHDERTKRKISKSIKRYFKTPEGRAQLARCSYCASNKWRKFLNSDNGKEHLDKIRAMQREMNKLTGDMCRDMHAYNKELNCMEE